MLAQIWFRSGEVCLSQSPSFTSFRLLSLLFLPYLIQTLYQYQAEWQTAGIESSGTSLPLTMTFLILI